MTVAIVTGASSGMGREFVRQLSRYVTVDEIWAIARRTDALEALKKLREAGCRLWLLSNAQEVFTRYELQHLGLLDAFDGIYLSSCFGCRKPDIRFFRALLEEQKLDPTKCLMIGNDRETDIAGAKAAGLATFYMHTALTPSHQSPADPNNPMEFEGDDWKEISEILLKI